MKLVPVSISCYLKLHLLSFISVTCVERHLQGWLALSGQHLTVKLLLRRLPAEQRSKGVYSGESQKGKEAVQLK